MTKPHAKNPRASLPPEATDAGRTKTSASVMSPAVPQRPRASAPEWHSPHAAEIRAGCTSVHAARGPSGRMAPATAGSAVARGITAEVPTLALRERIYERTLMLLHRHRVIRSLDVAAACFAERPYKAALTAAQRALRGLVRLRLAARYRTDRQQTVYALTARGAAWLQDAGREGAPSVRRVSDMTNPEHRLWLQFLAVACEARGLTALTESEALARLAARAPCVPEGAEPAHGLLTVDYTHAGRSVRQQLRPDALAFETDGATWFEVDASKRGAAREAALAALALGVGRTLALGQPLRRVVVMAKTERIRKRALAVLRTLARESKGRVLIAERRELREVEDGVFEVWGAVERRYPDGRTAIADARLGHVIVQALPMWLPKLRVRAAAGHVPGWFDEGSLPYRKPAALAPWPPCRSPLLVPDD